MNAVELFKISYNADRITLSARELQLKEFTSKYNNHADVQTLVTPKGRETFRLIYCNS